MARLAQGRQRTTLVADLLEKRILALLEDGEWYILMVRKNDSLVTRRCMMPKIPMVRDARRNSCTWSRHTVEPKWLGLPLVLAVIVLKVVVLLVVVVVVVVEELVVVVIVVVKFVVVVLF